VTRPEPSHSNHVAVARFVGRFIGDDGPGPDDPIQANVVSSIDWGYMINMGWALVAGACILAMGVIGFPLQALFGDGVGHVVICAGVGATFFCLAGSAEAARRRYVDVPRARRLAHQGDVDASEEALRRSLPPNGSLLSQAAIGVLAIVITAVIL